VLVFWSPKGGSGTSVVAAAVALHLAGSGGARLADLDGDQPAILGLTAEPATGLADWLATWPDAPDDALAHLALEAAPGLALLPRGSPLSMAGPVREGAGGALADSLAGVGSFAGVATVVDAGAASSAAVEALLCAPASTPVVVVRPCYLALRACVARGPVLSACAGAVVVDEAGRALRARDVSHVLALPVLARIRLEPSIARAVDAGTLPARVPTTLARAASVIVSVVPGRESGRAA